MRLRKTRQEERATYTYTFTNADGNEERVTLKPGENGVTEADIKMLHSFDDSEVYYNLKNLKPKRTEEEKAEIEKWKKEYINNSAITDVNIDKFLKEIWFIVDDKKPQECLLLAFLQKTILLIPSIILKGMILS